MTKSKKNMDYPSGALPGLPDIHRAREYHLYTKEGKRYLDLYLDQGRALLGHRPTGISLEMKNVMAKGVYAPYPAFFYGRLVRALSVLFPKCTEYRIYRNLDRVRSMLQELDILNPNMDIGRPLYDHIGDFQCAFWRPFLPGYVGRLYHEERTPVYIIPVLPCPGNFFPVPVCIKGSGAGVLPSSDPVSPVLLAALVRSVYELKRFSMKYHEGLWEQFPSPFWERKGPYLLMNVEGKDGQDLFRKCLDHGILIPPESSVPAVIPATWSDGEVSFLSKAVKG